MKLFRRSLIFFAILLVVYSILNFILLTRLSTFTDFLILEIILTLIVFLAAVMYMRSIVIPLEEIDHLLRKLVAGESIKILHNRRNPLLELFSNLETISEKIVHFEEKLKSHKTGFYTVIDSIQEAIWIQNDKGIIRTANEAFERLINQEKISGSYFWNIIRNKELYDFVDSVYREPDAKTRDISFDNKFFICSASILEKTREILFILYDVSEIKNLEMMKRDFILNVSHELRTPLTSIKGYLEALETEIEGKNKSFLEILQRNTDRLITIVNDLLILSRLEHKENLELEEIDLPVFFDTISKIFHHRLQKKGMQFEIDIPARIKPVRADRYKLEQVFINLIDNAIKHTDAGSVRIKIRQDENSTTLTVEDTGIGIAKEHHARIFERFYVVDKSRTRRSGSSGLGLAIVKHIINLHHGRIDLESDLGKGTKFIITLPGLKNAKQ